MGSDYDLLYLAFETVLDYMNSYNKDRSHWQKLFFNRRWKQKTERFANANISEIGDPKFAQALKDIHLPLNMATVEGDELKEQLAIQAKGGVIKRYHLAGYLSAEFEINNFIVKYGKDPIDHVLEDWEEEIMNFFILDLGFKLAAGSN